MSTNARKLTASLILSLTGFSTLTGQITAWNDSFASGTVNSNFTQFTAGSGASVTQSGGQMILDTAVVNGSAQAAVNTTTDATGTISTFNGADLYDFYSHEVQLSFDVASMTGSTTALRNVFFISIGEDAAGNFAPISSVLDNGIGLSFEYVASTTTFRIFYNEFVNAVEQNAGVVANLSGAPTGIDLSYNGTNLNISLTGATATTIGNKGIGTIGGSDLGVVMNDLSANIGTYSIAFGSFNLGNVSAATVTTLNSFSATAIPEPGSYALLAGILGAGRVLLRRRHQ
jgi:hypothetical protein